jgi:hypothetical protein
MSEWSAQRASRVLVALVRIGWRVKRAIPGATIRVLRLFAAHATILERLAKREIGSALQWHVRRSEEIARSTVGDPINAERSVTEVASEVLERAGWLRSTP